MKKIFIILAMGIITILSAAADTTPVSLINEDYIWVYHMSQPYENMQTDMYYKYSGTEEVYGRTYHRYVNFKNHERRWTSEEGEKETVYEGFETLVWLAREDDRRLIVIYPSETESDEHTEYVVNDFNLNVGDRVSDCPYYGYFYGYHECEEWIKYIDHVTINGRNCMVQWTYAGEGDITSPECLRPIVEGVGNCGVGTYDTLQQETNGMSLTMFSRLLDREGNILLDRETISKLNPVSGIAPIHDMDFPGIEITSGKVSCRASDGAEISLAVYHPDGRLAAKISDNGEVSLSTSVLETGVYVARATCGGHSTSRKIQVR